MCRTVVWHHTNRGEHHESSHESTLQTISEAIDALQAQMAAVCTDTESDARATAFVLAVDALENAFRALANYDYE